MSLQNAFANLSTEEKQDAILFLLAAMFEKMPRTTNTDQAAVSVENQVTVGIASNQDLRNITGSLALLTNIQQIGGGAIFPVNLNNAGLVTIYDNLKVS